jgi:hypothetical protein
LEEDAFGDGSGDNLLPTNPHEEFETNNDLELKSSKRFAEKSGDVENPDGKATAASGPGDVEDPRPDPSSSSGKVNPCASFNADGVLCKIYASMVSVLLSACFM